LIFTRWEITGQDKTVDTRFGYYYRQENCVHTGLKDTRKYRNVHLGSRLENTKQENYVDIRLKITRQEHCVDIRLEILSKRLPVKRTV
jgi:hypothetical protein